MRKMETNIGGTLCFLGMHKYVNIERRTPIPKNGEMICFTNLHECERCKKRKSLGMGCII